MIIKSKVIYFHYFILFLRLEYYIIKIIIKSQKLFLPRVTAFHNIVLKICAVWIANQQPIIYLQWGMCYPRVHLGQITLPFVLPVRMIATWQSSLNKTSLNRLIKDSFCLYMILLIYSISGASDVWSTWSWSCDHNEVKAAYSLIYLSLCKC